MNLQLPPFTQQTFVQNHTEHHEREQIPAGGLVQKHQWMGVGVEAEPVCWGGGGSTGGLPGEGAACQWSVAAPQLQSASDSRASGVQRWQMKETETFSFQQRLTEEEEEEEEELTEDKRLQLQLC